MTRVHRSAIGAAAIVALSMAAPTHAGQIDITTLAGYGVTSQTFNFGAGADWNRVVVPTGKVVLGAKIVSAGDGFQDFSVFTPAGPGQMFPTFTFGAGEYGWTMRSVQGQANPNVTVDVYYSDPLSDYTLSKSIDQTYGAGGLGGWAAPAGHSVTGGGYYFTQADSWAVSSQWTENSLYWSLWQPIEREGWLIQARDNKTWSPANLYVVSFQQSTSVPEPGTIALLSLPLLGVAAMRRRQASDRR
ncbi:MAG: PEP-CTERM sorting domain-containing protein [Burkholderiales bacterium]|jgi:hypothetical protein